MTRATNISCGVKLLSLAAVLRLCYYGKGHRGRHQQNILRECPLILPGHRPAQDHRARPGRKLPSAADLDNNREALNPVKLNPGRVSPLRIVGEPAAPALASVNLFPGKWVAACDRDRMKLTTVTFCSQSEADSIRVTVSVQQPGPHLPHERRGASVSATPPRCHKNLFQAVGFQNHCNIF